VVELGTFDCYLLLKQGEEDALTGLFNIRLTCLCTPMDRIRDTAVDKSKKGEKSLRAE
jgi:hypothetical protein